VTQAVIDELLTVLSDSSVVNSGKVRVWTDPETLETQSRTVTITKEVEQTQAVPYVRVTITDSGLIDGEPHGYGDQPVGRIMRAIILVFSDWEEEARSIADAIEALLVHRQLVTSDFKGWSWMEEASRYYTDTGDSAAVYRIAALTFRIIEDPQPA
jgi:hypothetical protein